MIARSLAGQSTNDELLGDESLGVQLHSRGGKERACLV